MDTTVELGTCINILPCKEYSRIGNLDHFPVGDGPYSFLVFQDGCL